MNARILLLVVAAVIVTLVLCAAGSTALLGGTSPALTCGTPEPDPSTSTSIGVAVVVVVSAPPTAGGRYPPWQRWSSEQVSNAATIVTVGARLNVPARGQIVALATALQESTLINVHHGDRDSQGLFQQRPSQGWGTRAQITDPAHAATSFYQRLLRVPHWETMPVTEAAQAVQGSAYGGAYAKWETDATALLGHLAGGASGLSGAADAGCAAMSDGSAVISVSGWTAPVTAAIVAPWGQDRGDHMHAGTDLGAARGTAILAAANGTVVVATCNAPAAHGCDTDGYPGLGGCGWYVEIAHSGDLHTRYCHMNRRPVVAVGDHVTAGQIIGHVGSSGNSSGPHLHFEVRPNAGTDTVDPVIFLRSKGVPLGQNGR